MTVTALLTTLRELGVRIWLEDGRLRFAAPQGRLTPELKEHMSRRRDEIIEILAAATPGPTSETIPRANRDHPIPLSFAQQRLWLLDQMIADRGVYNLATAVRLRGPLDRAALERAIAEVQRRHESLRTTYALQGTQPVQRVADAAAPPTVLDWTVGDSNPDRLVALATAAYREPFDLATGPVFRATVVVLAPDHHALILACHHIASDGVSNQIILGELAVLYDAFAAGRESPLPPPPLQYPDFAAWQRGQQQQVLERQVEYWKRRLAGAPPLLELATDRKRPAIRTFNGATQAFALSPETSRAVDALAKESGATPFMVLLGAFGYLMKCYARQEDIVVGSPIAGRDRSELERVVGFFVNTVVLRLDLSGSPSSVQLLERVRETVLGAFSHADVSVEQVVDALGVPRRLDANPLFQVMFGLEPPAGGGPVGTFAGCAVEPIGAQGNVAKFDLTCSMAPTAAGYHGAIEFNTDLFDSTTIDRMIEVFRAIIEGIVRQPAQPLDQIDLLSLPAKDALLAMGRGPVTRYPDQPAPGLFEDRVRLTPDAVALDYHGQLLSYRELNARANQLARHLRALGVGPDVPVALCLPRSVDLIVAMVATLKAGGAYVPLDPEHPRARQAHVLADARPPVLLTTAALAEPFEGGGYLGALVRLDTEWSTVASLPADDLAPVANLDHLAYIIYTSGSTGQPKGVAVPLRAINRLVFETNYVDLRSTDRVAQAASATFDAATFEVWGALLHGARLVGIPRDVTLDPNELAATLRAKEISVLFLTTALFNQVARVAPGAFGGLRYLLFGGEAVDPKWVRVALEHGSPEHLLHVYGPTESTTFATWFPVASQLDDGATVPIGHPIANTDAHVLDSRGNLVPVGVPGELYLGGDGLARGYLNEPTLTDRRFVPNPFGPGRLYRTGDVVRRRTDGAIEFIGRTDFQVKIRGFRVELGEVESAIHECPGVTDVVAIVREDVPGDHRLVAYLVANPTTTTDEIRAALRERLPAFMVPAAIVKLPALPINVAGKIDRAALPAPEYRDAQADAAIAPRTDHESAISAVWREVLRVDQIGVTDNFFDVGGHSLLLVELHRRLVDTLGCQLTVVQLFANPTIESQARLIGGNQQPTPGSAARVRRAVASGRADEPIAIVGMAGRFPGAPDVDAFWTNLRAGRESITRFSDDQLRAAGFTEEWIRRPEFVAARGVIDDVDRFDSTFFGYSAREADLTDPQQRLFLECCHQALEHAGCDPARFAGLIGVFGGCGPNSYGDAIRQDPSLAALGAMQILLGSDRAFLTTRVSYKLDLRGPSYNVQTACSTSLVAVHLACQSLLRGESDLAIAGGASINVPIVDGYLYQEDGILSPDGHCRPFDADSHGTVSGSGVATVVLQRVSDALRDGATIHAVIKGSAINNDGHLKVGYTAPSVQGQAEVIAAALAAGDVDPRSIGYVETHGTATSLGDPIEIEALSTAFGPGAPGSCAIGSVKSNVGHLDSAAGVTGLIKAALCLEHRTLVPSLHYQSPNPRIDFANTPFAVNTETRPWTNPADRPRRAAVSSFGIGGTNAHVVLEEPPPPAPSAPGRPHQLVVLSAKTPAALDRATARLADYFDSNPTADLADVAYTLHVGRQQHAHRRAIVAADLATAVAACRDARSPRVATGQARPGPGGVVFMFPGQGAQYVGMGHDLYRTEPVFRATIDECAALTAQAAGFDLRSVLYPTDPTHPDAEANLRRTSAAQLGLFAVELAMARLWISWGVEPTACIGHSIGEYVAACLAGVLTLEDALKLVVLRGKLMDHAPAGAMIAVPLAEADLTPRLGDDLWLAAVNGPSACVVSGAADRIASFGEALRADGIESRRLPTAGAFHSALMDAVKDPLRDAAATIVHHPAKIRYLSNVTGRWAGTEVADPEYWARHLRETVRFDPGVTELLAAGARVFLEVGPGQALTSLVKRRRAVDGQEPTAIATMRRPGDAGADDEALTRALGNLWLAGHPIDWARYHQDATRRRVILPTYPFESKRHWIEPAPAALPSPVPKGKRPDLRDWLYLPTWKRSLPAAARPPAETPESWLLLADDHGVAAAVRESLGTKGVRVAVARVAREFRRVDPDHFSLDPTNPGDYRKLVAALREEGRTPTHVIHAWGLTGAAERQVELERGFFSVLHLLQALDVDRRTDPLTGIVVTSRAQAVLGRESVRPARTTILGLCQVAGQEMPHVRLRPVDLEAMASQPGPSADQLINEARAPAAEPVAYRGSTRWLHVLEPLHVPAAEPASLREQGHYLVTGGLGNVALALASVLATACRARLTLLARRPLPDRAEWDRVADPAVARLVGHIRELEARGATVQVVQADVTDRAQMEAALVQAEERLGPIHGVIHAAGTTGGPSFAPIADLTVEHCLAQFGPKLAGTEVLAEVVAHRPLDFVALTSSLSTALGGLSFAAYAAANHAEDAFADARANATATRWISIGFDGWHFGPDPIDPNARGAARYAMTAAEGAAAFALALSVPGASRLLVSTAPIAERTMAHADSVDADASSPTIVAHERPGLDTPFIAPGDETERLVAATMEDILGVRPIGVNDDFFALGGDSLIAVQLMFRLTEKVGIRLGTPALFEAPTAAGLAAKIRALQSGPKTDDADVAAIQAMVDGLSDEEVLRLLSETGPDGSPNEEPK